MVQLGVVFTATTTRTFFVVVTMMMILSVLFNPVSIIHRRASSHRIIVQAFSVSNSFQKSRQQSGARPTVVLNPQLALIPTNIPKKNGSHPTRTRTSYLSSTSSSSIVDEVADEMKKAMKAKDTTRLNAIRLIRSSFANAAIELKTEKLSDPDAQNVLKKLAKMRKESIELYETNGAIDRADAERAELEIINQWLPQAVSDDVVRQWVIEAIEQVGGGASSNMGKVMGAFMKAHKNDNVDGTVVQKIVKEELAKLQ